jgi:transcriptional regulator with XRE-family HTH domain
MDLGEKIKTLRKKLGLSQGELAAKVEINPTHLSRLETGRYQPSVELLKKLSDVFEVTTDSLLGAADEQAPEVKIQNRPLVDRIRLIETLDEADQQALVQVIDSMLTKQKMRQLLNQAASLAG